ncbi:MULTISPECIES: hypothetical protein [unclassified Streptomyces]|uniref:hypothetical protein n=1 Tax=unclassified Streptomyces TaxID=2593676 RepID=UPI000B2ED05C|nr:MULTISPECIES: hypothetical protein [unclassified Streptomyces]
MSVEYVVQLVAAVVPPLLMLGLVVWVTVRVFRRAPWAGLAAVLLLGTVVLYLWGMLALFTLDIAETCALRHHQPYDWEAVRAGQSLLPLSAPCNASYDMVPGYVNPGLLVGIAGTAGAAVMAVRAGRARRRRTVDVT